MSYRSLRECGTATGSLIIVKGAVDPSALLLTGRCVRHALIFDLPWPAHRAADVQVYPPSHLIPNGYIPRKISSFPLPSLVKTSKKKVAEPEPSSPESDTKMERAARRLRLDIDHEEFIVQQLRETAWELQQTVEAAAALLAEARADAQKQREEAKRKRNENKVRGSGLWSRYEYISAEEVKRREEARYLVTSGTRRGGRFRKEENEEEMMRMAEENRLPGVPVIDDGDGLETTEVTEGGSEDGGEESSTSIEDLTPPPVESGPDIGPPGHQVAQEDETGFAPTHGVRPRRSLRTSLSARLEPLRTGRDSDLPTGHDSPAGKLRKHARGMQARGTIIAPPAAGPSTGAAYPESVLPPPSSRRGRPRGSGKLKRAEAARIAEALKIEAASGCQADDKSVTSPLLGGARDVESSPDKPSQAKGKGKALTSPPPHVITSGIEVPDVSDGGMPLPIPHTPAEDTASAVASSVAGGSTLITPNYPVTDGILIPPSKPAVPSDSEIPSVETASPSPGHSLASNQETEPDATSLVMESDAMEGEIVVAPAVEPKGKRASEGSVSLGRNPPTIWIFA